MTEDQIEELLWEEESNYLDFKSHQYRFIGADEDDKSELLKDILAFTNAFRRQTAYILIGVDEVKGDRSKPLGIDQHIDDANLQQFVNKKTNRIVEFAYIAASVDGKRIAAIEIPLQKRPVYLTRDYGKLKKETVYVKHGSATDIASIDEIAAMGREPAELKITPTLDLALADVSSQTILGQVISIESTNVIMPLRGEIPTLSVDMSPSSLISMPDPSANREYYREFADFLRANQLHQEIGFALTNTGPVALSNVRIEARADNSSGLSVRQWLPRRPTKDYHSSMLAAIAAEGMSPHLTIDEFQDRFVIEASEDGIQPKRTEFSEPFYIGSDTDSRVVLKAAVYADELEDPIRFELGIEIVAETLSIGSADIVRLADGQ